MAAGVGHMVRDLGYTYVRAAQAADALRLLEQGDGFDLVFSDMVMPGDMDGLALAKAIRARDPDLPVVLTTGFSEAAAAATAERFRLLSKPYGIEALATVLGEALRLVAPAPRGGDPGRPAVTANGNDQPARRASATARRARRCASWETAPEMALKRSRARPVPSIAVAICSCCSAEGAAPLSASAIGCTAAMARAN